MLFMSKCIRFKDMPDFPRERERILSTKQYIYPLWTAIRWLSDSLAAHSA